MDLKNEQPAGSASCFFLLFLDAPHLVKHDTLAQLVEARIAITLTKVLTQFSFNRSNHLAAQGRKSGKINKECEGVLIIYSFLSFQKMFLLLQNRINSMFFV